ncbi:MAG: L-histidine N(alpha)-methyltransferase [Hyphomicrobiaceae bacterium]
MAAQGRKVELVAAEGQDERAQFEADVVAGLSKPQKTLPCQYFYDASGSALFEEITRMPEYYPTVTELGILERHVRKFAQEVADARVLVEFGSGSSVKTELLLSEMRQLEAYVPIDVSATALDQAAARLQDQFPALSIAPIVGDFTQPIALPKGYQGKQLVGFFPGSTVGNFAPREAVKLLSVLRRSLGEGAHLLIGVDLQKDVKTLKRAYDDAAGVTAAFNLNVLTRINRELGGDFELDAFQHEARYNDALGRIEMHLVSDRDQSVQVGEHGFHFAEGESIHTENSHKFTIAGFRQLAEQAGWVSSDVWTDDDQLFSVHDLIVRAC